MALPTKHHAVGYYLNWYFRLYEASDHGWRVARMPDDRPIGEQDHFFWSALEAIARTMNLMLVEERRRLETAGKH